MSNPAPRPMSMEGFREQIRQMTMVELSALATVLRKQGFTEEAEVVAEQIAKLQGDMIERQHRAQHNGGSIQP